MPVETDDPETAYSPYGVTPAGGRFAAGSKVGPYSLISFLGRGAFGEVWLAERDSAIAKTKLAVKLPLYASVDLVAVRKEAEVWVKAGNHPNVLPIFEADIYSGQVAIVSEYAPDGCLGGWMKKHGGKAPSFEVAVDMAMAVLAGLEHLHVRGIVHRDLKPANILMQGECPRIADFGLARLIELDATLSLVAGTPAYMAPEAFNGRRTVQTDLWSVGIILYQMLNGRLPFESPQLLSLMMAIATDTPPALPDDVPSSLRQAVLAAMDKDPKARFESAAGMRAALRDTFKQLETRSDVPAPLPRRGARTVAVTGSTRADPRRTAHRVRTLLTPHLGDDTTWYCGTVGAVDECAVDYLSKERQRVIAVGYGAWDISDAMTTLLARHGVPFVNAQDVQIVNDRHAPNGRDLFFTTKADLVVVFWDGASAGIAELLAWLRKQGKDHVLGFV